jgi:hypothetical protein
VKGVLGLILRRVGAWGLWMLLPNTARSQDSYRESKLKNKALIKDGDGFPVHPYYLDRSVSFLPRYSSNSYYPRISLNTNTNYAIIGS